MNPNNPADIVALAAFYYSTEQFQTPEDAFIGAEAWAEEAKSRYPELANVTTGDLKSDSWQPGEKQTQKQAAIERALGRLRTAAEKARLMLTVYVPNSAAANASETLREALEALYAAERL